MKVNDLLRLMDNASFVMYTSLGSSTVVESMSLINFNEPVFPKLS